MRKSITIIFAVGIIALCFFAPFKIQNLGRLHPGEAEFTFEHLPIFSNDGALQVGRFFIYIVVWAAICFSLYVGFRKKG